VFYRAPDGSPLIPRLHPGMGPFDFDPDAVLAAFGARFATLSAPGFEHRWVSSLFSDSSAEPLGRYTGTPSRDGLYPLTVTVRHNIGSSRHVDVVTRRRSTIVMSLSEHMWWSLVDLRINTSGLRGEELRSFGHSVALRRPPVETSQCRVVLDGEPAQWLLLVDDDLAMCGAESTEDTLIAAVCPVGLVGQLSIETLPLAGR
jgi:hypothetical protein